MLQRQPTPPEKILLSRENIGNWPIFLKLLKNGKIKFDHKGKLRYLHGAPVGDLILVKIDQHGNPIYKESSQEWFDPDSEKARNFSWPKK